MKAKTSGIRHTRVSREPAVPPAARPPPGRVRTAPLGRAAQGFLTQVPAQEGSPAGGGCSGCPRVREPVLVPIFEEVSEVSERWKCYTWVFGLHLHLVFNCCCSHLLALHSDRLVPELDTIVPSESAKAYDMLDIVHSVSLTVFRLKMHVLHSGFK